MRLRLFTLLLAGAMATATTRARADDAALVEVRLGNAVSWLGTSSGGAAAGERLLGVPGTPWTASLPGWLRWALEPQAQELALTSTTGTTNSVGQGYRGLTWSVPLASGLLHRDDAISFGFSVGQSFGDLGPGSEGLDRRLAPATPLLRLGAGIGYQVTPRIGLYVLFDHVESSGPMRDDESKNDLGIRVGLRF
jgi:hypothetical protein